MKKMIDEFVIRSPLIVAGNNEYYIRKAFTSEADCIVLDLEDGVSNDFKEEARQEITELLTDDVKLSKPVLVRVNSFSSGLLEKDLEAVLHKDLSGIVYPKVKNGNEIVHLSKLISRREKKQNIRRGSIAIIPIIETPVAMLNLKEIAFSSQRLTALLLGAEDLLADLQGYHGLGGRTLQAIRTQIALAARAASLIALDTPFLKIGMDNDLKEFIQPAKELGFEGMLAISPSQVGLINKEYTPDELEYDEAVRLVKISEKLVGTGKRVALKDGLFVSAPTEKRARKLINRYEKILKFKDEKLKMENDN